ncbi:MAG TPA: SDR family oxidoreductase [Thermoleophilaceae bacterium]|jgi:NAD(P)-dependent dehydrogenase (short-subunit alcohol dehydrogenase family)
MTGGALVTGAASGIGAAIAGRLAERGWRVAGVDLEESGTELALRADVSDRAAVAAAVARATEELGPISLLVTAAGFYEMVPVAEIDDERWRRMLRVHLGGAANACWEVLPGMLARGEGIVVTISSELALAGGGPGDAHYAAAKGAVLGFTRSLGWELADKGIRVNSVAPGPTDTPLLPPDSPWRAPDYLATLPLGRLVTPDEVADSVVFLVEEGTYFQGQALSPNAGAVI